MTQRSPLNQRHSKYGKPAGSSRKSAASAKPKRVSGSGSSATKSTASGGSRAAFIPTPEYKRWRNIWWTLAGIGATIAGAYLLYPLVAHQQVPRSWALPGIVVSWLFIGLAIWVDLRKVRPAREAAMAASVLAASGKAPKPVAPAEKRDEKRDQDEDDEDDEEDV